MSLSAPVPSSAEMSCPSCGFEQAAAAECLKCGLVIAKFRPRPVAPGAPAAPLEPRGSAEIAADLAAQGYMARAPAAGSETLEDDESFFAPEKAGLRKGVAGGLVMMAIAVIWFGLGWSAGYIFFYPPILFAIGLFGLLKGLFTGNLAGE